MLRKCFVPAIVAGCLVAPAAAQEGLPRNTINCQLFEKEANGNWRVRQETTFDIGDINSLTVGTIEISPGSLNVGVDVYDVLEKKCGGK